jgi:hypothetical protein
MNANHLSQRVRVFREAGLLDRVPTLFQLHQGELQMAPYVTSTDATAEEGYRGARLGHPVLRQPLIVSQVGLDHFRLGSALGVKLSSLCAHLQLTFHQGMPVFDLQVIQTHDDGLDVLRSSLVELLAGRTPRARRRRRLASLILANPDAYWSSFLGDQGWIARAARFDYPDAEEQGSAFPPEYYSLVGFLRHCAESFPASASEVPLRAWPTHVLDLVSRRFREGRGFGWFARRGGVS